MRKNLVFPLVALVISMSAAAVVTAAGNAYNKVIDVGAAAPTWSDLEGTDGKKHSLSEYKDAKVIVEVFTCNTCPVAKAYEDRLMKLQKDYKDQGVQVVAICVNKSGNELPDMKQRAEEKGFNFPYLRDPSQDSGRAIGATVTPHVFVFDADRKIAYMGAIDDNFENADDVKKTYLRDAVDAVLAGKKPAVSANKPTGCGIGY